MISYYLIIINIFSFLMMSIDKIKAIRDYRRIRNNHLYLLSFIGGFIGVFLAMKIVNHKSNQLSYYYVVLLSLIIWLILIFKFDIFYI